MILLHFLPTFLGGLAVDWAVIGRLEQTLLMPDLHNRSFYRHTFFPRIMFTIAGLLLLSLGTSGNRPNPALSAIGASISLAATLFPFFQLYWRGRSN